MQIQSAFASGVQGYQRAEQGVREASLEIARQPVAQQEMQAAAEGELAAAEQAQPASQSQPVTEAMVQLRMEERNAQANAKVIETADQVVGSLIDTRV